MDVLFPGVDLLASVREYATATATSKAVFTCNGCGRGGGERTRLRRRVYFGDLLHATGGMLRGSGFWVVDVGAEFNLGSTKIPWGHLRISVERLNCWNHGPN